MIYPKIPLAQSIIEIFRVKGIKNIVISPGSRNAPLTLGFANNPHFNCFSIADERCAGFFALGIAQQLSEPVALVCTSGSALLNYYPAFAEAFYSQIPLIVLSADRPLDKIDIGDGQTIRQQNVFDNHSIYNANLLENASLENDFKIQEAIQSSILKKGPVHINVPFEEPLYETTSVLEIAPKYTTDNIETKKVENLVEFAKIWNVSTKKMILVGANNPLLIDDNLTNLIANDNSIIVMTEAISNWHHDSFLTNIDAIIAPFNESEYIETQPEILITFGGMIVSKRVKTMLRKYKPLHHWHIDELRAYDVFDCLTHHFELSPNNFFSIFLPLTNKIESNYNQFVSNIKTIRALKHNEFLARIPFTDLKAFENIFSSLPKNSILQLSNSTTIRYAQLFEIDKTIEIFCNRGTSGIDGSTSTAIGAAVANKKQTILITGDIGFFYDSNALWNNYLPKNFKIIILNNGGGGIFRILPGHNETPVFNTFFETSHNFTAEHLAKMYDFEYRSANSETSLRMQVENFYLIDKPAILEIFTPTKQNNKCFVDYFNHLI